MQTLLIDTDPGVDDALALLMAHAHAGTRVAAITTTAGNVGLAHTTRNARRLLALMGADTPVFPGCETPLVRLADDAAFVHGRDGFGDVGYEPVPEPGTPAEHATLAMLALSRRHARGARGARGGPCRQAVPADHREHHRPDFPAYPRGRVSRCLAGLMDTARVLA